MLTQLRSTIPKSAKQKLRRFHRQFVLRSALAEFGKLRSGSIPSRSLCERLVYGWGNEGWSSQTELLQELVRRFWQSTDPVLDCGSGLSTLLLGVLAKKHPRRIISLEHHGQWLSHVDTYLTRYSLSAVELCHAPLREHADYDWYDLGKINLPASFSLAICDGPPGDTRGGRFGLVPLLGSRLPQGSVLLMDDIDRPAEKNILERWMGMKDFSSRNVGDSHQFAIITVTS